MEVPMLDENEWTEVSKHLTNMSERIKTIRKEQNCSLHEAQEKAGLEACEAYYRITGFKETNHLALYHHRLSEVGEVCKSCGKPYRSPEASFCAECGNKN